MARVHLFGDLQLALADEDELCFVLTFDPAIVTQLLLHTGLGDPTGPDESGEYTRESGWRGSVKDDLLQTRLSEEEAFLRGLSGNPPGLDDPEEDYLPEEELHLPASFLYAMKRLFRAIPCERICYDCVGATLIIRVYGALAPVRQPDRLLQATARKFGRWLREPIPSTQK